MCRSICRLVLGKRNPRATGAQRADRRAGQEASRPPTPHPGTFPPQKQNHRPPSATSHLRTSSEGVLHTSDRAPRHAGGGDNTAAPPPTFPPPSERLLWRLYPSVQQEPTGCRDLTWRFSLRTAGARIRKRSVLRQKPGRHFPHCESSRLPPPRSQSERVHCVCAVPPLTRPVV